MSESGPSTSSGTGVTIGSTVAPMSVDKPFLKIDRALTAIADTYHDFFDTRCTREGIEPSKHDIQQNFLRIINGEFEEADIPVDRLFMYEGVNCSDRNIKGTDLEESVLNFLDFYYPKKEDQHIVIPSDDLQRVLLNEAGTVPDTKKKLNEFFGSVGSDEHEDICIIYDQFPIKLIGAITDDINSTKNKRILNVQPICGLWDEAGKSRTRRVDVRLTGLEETYIPIDHTANIQFGHSNNKNYVQVFGGDINIGGEPLYPIDPAKNKFWDTELNKEVLHLGVNDLCQAYAQAVANKRNNILNIIFNNNGKNATFVRKDTDFYKKVQDIFTPTMFKNLGHINIKRSGDFGQVAMVKYLNNTNKQINMTVYGGFDENKRVLQVSQEIRKNKMFVLMTGDKLCCARARIEGIPVIFYSHRDDQVLLYKGENHNVTFKHYFKKLQSYTCSLLKYTGSTPINIGSQGAQIKMFETFFAGTFSIAFGGMYEAELNSINQIGKTIDIALTKMKNTIETFIPKVHKLQQTLASQQAKTYFKALNTSLVEIYKDPKEKCKNLRDHDPFAVLKQKYDKADHLEALPFLVNVVSCNLSSCIGGESTNTVKVLDAVSLDSNLLNILKILSLYPSKLVYKNPRAQFQGIIGAFLFSDVGPKYSKYIDLYHSVPGRIAKNNNLVINAMQMCLARSSNRILRGFAKKLDGLQFYRPYDAYFYVFEQQCYLFIDKIEEFIESMNKQSEMIDVIDGFLGNGVVTPTGKPLRRSSASASASEGSIEGDGEGEGEGEDDKSSSRCLKRSKSVSFMNGGKCNDAEVFDLNVLLCNCPKYLESYLTPDSIEDIQVMLMQVMYCYHIPLNSWLLQGEIVEHINRSESLNYDTIKNVVFAALKKYIIFLLKNAPQERSDPYNLLYLLHFCIDYRRNSIMFTPLANDFFNMLYTGNTEESVENDFDVKYPKFIEGYIENFDVDFVKDEQQIMINYIKGYVHEVYNEIQRFASVAPEWAFILRKYTVQPNLITKPGSSAAIAPLEPPPTGPVATTGQYAPGPGQPDTAGTTGSPASSSGVPPQGASPAPTSVVQGAVGYTPTTSASGQGATTGLTAVGSTAAMDTSMTPSTSVQNLLTLGQNIEFNRYWHRIFIESRIESPGITISQQQLLQNQAKRLIAFIDELDEGKKANVSVITTTLEYIIRNAIGIQEIQEIQQLQNMLQEQKNLLFTTLTSSGELTPPQRSPGRGRGDGAGPSGLGASGGGVSKYRLRDYHKKYYPNYYKKYYGGASEGGRN